MKPEQALKIVKLVNKAKCVVFWLISCLLGMGFSATLCFALYYAPWPTWILIGTMGFWISSVCIGMWWDDVKNLAKVAELKTKVQKQIQQLEENEIT